MRLWGKSFFVVYILFLIYFLIFSDWYGRTQVMEEYHYNLVPFQEIKRFWYYRDQLQIWSVINLFGNIAIFIPLGFFEAMASVKKSFLWITIDGFMLSLLVEVFQLISKVGRFDVDDLILNTCGVIIGYLTFWVCSKMRRANGTKR